MKTQYSQAKARHGLLLLLLSAILWGTVGVVIQALYELSATNPLSVAFLRLALSLPALFLACQLTLGKQAFKVAPRYLWLMLLIGAMTALYQVCYFAAIARIGVAAATLITLCTAPVWVAILALILLKERLTTGVCLSGSCAVVGTILLVDVQTPTTMQSNSIFGILLALSSSSFYALVVLSSRTLAGKCHPLQSLTVGFSAGTLILLPFALGTGLVISYSGWSWLLLLYLGIVPTALAYLLYFSGIRHTTATIASIATLLEPLTATILAWWFFGEQLGAFGLLGAAMLLIASGLLYLENLRR